MRQQRRQGSEEERVEEHDRAREQEEAAHRGRRYRFAPALISVLAVLTLPAAGTAGTVFLLDGRGWGHGVGMSQWGAEGYARHGYDYRRILAHYYPHTTLAVAAPTRVRVLLEQAALRVRVGSAAPFLVVDARGRTLHMAPRDVVVDRRFELHHLRLTPPLKVEPGAQPLTLDGAGYRGELIVQPKPAGLMVVNELSLDLYLRGVVPWEVPAGWRQATYEAQTVAARSYTLATLRPRADFDLYPDQRSQMYGGIRAERPDTNLAIGQTAAQVLTWRGRIITAYYFSSSGGKTSSVHDAWPWVPQVPYLVSVDDPYDYISPHHVWPTTVLTQARVDAVLGLRGVRDLRVVDNSSGRARAVHVLTASGWRVVSGALFRRRFHLVSSDFDLSAMELADPPAAVYGSAVRLHGWLRGLGRARLQELTGSGWRTVRQVGAGASGHFALTVRAVRSTEYRLAYNGVGGAETGVLVAPRVTLRADGTRLRVQVAPRLPLQVQRLVRDRWLAVARGEGAFDRALRPGSYRVSVGAPGYVTTVTRPLGLHA